MQYTCAPSSPCRTLPDCYYHWRFGAAARLCEALCSWSGNDRRGGQKHVTVPHHSATAAPRNPTRALHHQATRPAAHAQLSIPLYQYDTAAALLPDRSWILMSVKDRASGMHFLVDTGAAISAIPPTVHQPTRRHPSYDFLAADGAPIPSYGTHTLSLDLVPRSAFVWDFVVTDVTQAILGADFLTAFDLLVDSRRRRLLYRPSISIIPVYPAPLS